MADFRMALTALQACFNQSREKAESFRHVQRREDADDDDGRSAELCSQRLRTETIRQCRRWRAVTDIGRNTYDRTVTNGDGRNRVVQRVLSDAEKIDCLFRAVPA